MGDERLTRAQAEAIFRRAAEIEATQELDADLDMAALEEIAEEAGLSRPAVRQAALELRTGAVPAPRTRVLGPPSVAVVRTVDVPMVRVQAEVDAWLERQQMRVRRRLDGRTVWEPATGIAAQVVRAVDLGKQVRLKDVTLLTVDVVDVGEGRTHVRVELDFTKLRSGWLGGIAAVGATSAAGLALLAAGLGGELAAVAGAVMGAGGGLGGMYAAAQSGMRSRQAAGADALECMLDELGAASTPRTATLRMPPRLRRRT